MISLYDAPTARIACEAGVDALLVGDSMGNVILGYENTLPVTMEEMVGHTAAVVRGVRSSSAPRVPVVADLPFGSYPNEATAIGNAVRLMQVGAHAVKLEGNFPHLVAALKAQGIPVMGHLGFTPQSLMVLENTVQGRGAEGSTRFLDAARDLDEAGIFGLVLEAMVDSVAAEVTEAIGAPTIGIGAGVRCSGQILVFQDLVGLSQHTFRFVKRYADTAEVWKRAAEQYIAEVREEEFPRPENSWTQ